MKRAIILPCLLLAMALVPMPQPGRADDSELTPERFNMLDSRGYFTPGFKTAVHAYIDTKKALEQARADVKNYQGQLPGIQQQSKDAVAKTESLRKELAKYQHPEDDDYAALVAVMKNPSAKSDDQLALAQAFIWAYPDNTHANEAKQDLQDIQKKQADEKKAAQDAEAARAAAEATLMRRVQARSLSLNEWREFLLDKSQLDLFKYLGRPDVVRTDYWIYSTAFTTDPITGQKIGLMISFNGTRVNSVASGPNVTAAP